MNWKDKFFRIAPVMLAVVTSGCTMSQVSLDYQPTLAQVVKGRPVLAVGRFTNSRGESAKYLGVVRTPIGTPLEYIYTRTSVEDIVRNAFTHACNARGMLTSTSSAQYIVTGEVLEVSCSQLVHPYGYARIRMNVVRAATGEMVFTRVYAGERQNAAYRPGSGSPVPALRELASRALQDAVDRALDDPEFRGRIRGGAPHYQPGML